MKRNLLFLVALLSACALQAQVWKADLGNGKYKNPVLYADYSDPDVCRVGEDFYMTSSSFNCVPGLQILHSKDLVNWEIAGTALPSVLPGTEGTEAPQYGNCVWAPSIRYHEGWFYIFYGDPDRGIYMLRTQDVRGLWSEPVLVKKGKGLIDPCPLWDENGHLYLVHAFAGSRAGLKSVLAVCELSADATRAITESRIVYDGHKDNPTIEGPKFYKRNGYYYIFAPAGGVRQGWQLALRSNAVYGPYEPKVVLQQGETSVNGPHQGAWVDTEEGEDWFLHFQDAGVYGRIVHLQPMVWESDWPVIGKYGEPVKQYHKPKTAAEWAQCAPTESDEFDSTALGLQWQWAANLNPKWYYCDAREGLLRLFSYAPTENNQGNVRASKDMMLNIPNLLLQKTPAPQFTVTAKVRFAPHEKNLGERAGMILTGKKSAYWELYKQNDGIVLSLKSELLNMAVTSVEPKQWIWLRIRFAEKGSCIFSYSLDGRQFKRIEIPVQAVEGQWIGAKIGLFCTRASQNNNDGGWLDVDWWRITE